MPATNQKVEPKLGQWNRFRIRLKDDRVMVYLNNKLISDSRQLAGIAERGRIGLEHHGEPVEFAVLFVRETGKDE